MERDLLEHVDEEDLQLLPRTELWFPNCLSELYNKQWACASSKPVIEEG